MGCEVAVDQRYHGHPATGLYFVIDGRDILTYFLFGQFGQSRCARQIRLPVRLFALYTCAMKIVTARPIDNDSFAPYGQLLDVPEMPGRYDFQAELFNGRTDAVPNLLLACAEAKSLPLDMEVMERHPHSSQAFFPLEASRYIVLVCPDGADGGPDMARLDAFIVGAGQGINYNPGTWHHPLTALERAGNFAALVWESGSEADTEWYTLAPEQRLRIDI